MLLIKTVKKRLKYLSKIQLSRRLKVDLWGDILYTQANSRLFKRFLRKRVYSFRNYFIYGKKNSRHPLKIPKNRRFFFKTKRFLYILRHNRSFLNWFKTFKHHDRVFFSRQIRFKTLRNLLYKNPSQFSNVKSLLLPQVTKFGQLITSDSYSTFKDSVPFKENNLLLYFKNSTNPYSSLTKEKNQRKLNESKLFKSRLLSITNSKNDFLSYPKKISYSLDLNKNVFSKSPNIIRLKPSKRKAKPKVLRLPKSYDLENNTKRYVLKNYKRFGLLKSLMYPSIDYLRAEKKKKLSILQRGFFRFSLRNTTEYRHSLSKYIRKRLKLLRIFKGRIPFKFKNTEKHFNQLSKRASDNFSFISPRSYAMKKLYHNTFDESSNISLKKVSDSRFYRFLKTRDSSWFFDFSRPFFTSFKRRFFSIYTYLPSGSKSYFSTLSDYIKFYSMNPNFKSLHSNRIYYKRYSSSWRPAYNPEFFFSSVFKRRFLPELKKRSNPLFELRRNHLFELFRTRGYKKNFSKYIWINSFQSLKVFIGTKSNFFRNLKVFSPPSSSIQGMENITHLRTFMLLRKGPTLASSFHAFRRKFKRIFKKKRRVFRFRTRFTRKDYMDILLNRKKDRRRYKTCTFFKKGLREHTKLRAFYGFMRKKIFRSAFRFFYVRSGKESFFKFLRSLECRLYMVLFRSGLVNSVRMAKQIVLHSHVKVNNSIVSNFNYLVRKGDLVTLDPKFTFLDRNKIFKTYFSSLRKRFVPRSDLVVSYKIPAIVMSDIPKDLGFFKYTFKTFPSEKKLRKFYRI